MRSQWMNEIDGELVIEPTKGGWNITNKLGVALTNVRFFTTDQETIEQTPLLLPNESVVITATGLSVEGEGSPLDSRPTPAEQAVEDTGDVGIGDEHERLLPSDSRYPMLYATLEHPYEGLRITGIQPQLAQRVLLRVRLDPTHLGEKPAGPQP